VPEPVNDVVEATPIEVAIAVIVEDKVELPVPKITAFHGPAPQPLPVE
jgi:hypothetical protein